MTAGSQSYSWLYLFKVFCKKILDGGILNWKKISGEMIITLENVSSHDSEKKHCMVSILLSMEVPPNHPPIPSALLVSTQKVYCLSIYSLHNQEIIHTDF